MNIHLLDETCQIGDAIGNVIKKQELEGLYSLQKCIIAVREQHPFANGIQITNPCPNKCLCYAIYGMSGWNTTVSAYKSCMITKGNFSKQYQSHPRL